MDFDYFDPIRLGDMGLVLFEPSGTRDREIESQATPWTLGVFAVAMVTASQSQRSISPDIWGYENTGNAGKSGTTNKPI